MDTELTNLLYSNNIYIIKKLFELEIININDFYESIENYQDSISAKLIIEIIDFLGNSIDDKLAQILLDHLLDHNCEKYIDAIYKLLDLDAKILDKHLYLLPEKIFFEVIDNYTINYDMLIEIIYHKSYNIVKHVLPIMDDINCNDKQIVKIADGIFRCFNEFPDRMVDKINQHDLWERVLLQLILTLGCDSNIFNYVPNDFVFSKVAKFILMKYDYIFDENDKIIFPEKRKCVTFTDKKYRELLKKITLNKY